MRTYRKLSIWRKNTSPYAVTSNYFAPQSHRMKTKIWNYKIGSGVLIGCPPNTWIVRLMNLVKMFGICCIKLSMVSKGLRVPWKLSTSWWKKYLVIPQIYFFFFVRINGFWNSTIFPKHFFLWEMFFNSPFSICFCYFCFLKTFIPIFIFSRIFLGIPEFYAKNPFSHNSSISRVFS